MIVPPVSLCAYSPAQFHLRSFGRCRTYYIAFALSGVIHRDKNIFALSRRLHTPLLTAFLNVGTPWGPVSEYP